MADAPDPSGAVAAYWSHLRLGISAGDVEAAWAAAAEQVWNDERYVARGASATRATFLFNSGHVRFTVCECVLHVAPFGDTTHFLTAVLEATAGLDLGWAIHTRTLDTVWGPGWPNPAFGERAHDSWSQYVRLG